MTPSKYFTYADGLTNDLHSLSAYLKDKEYYIMLDRLCFYKDEMEEYKREIAQAMIRKNLNTEETRK